MSELNELTIAELEAATKNEPNSPEAWEALAQKYFDENRHEEAAAAATRTILLGKDSFEIRKVRAFCLSYGENANKSQAIQDMKKALTFDPTNIEITQELADLYGNTNDYGSALELYTQVLLLEPNNTWALECRSQLYAEQGDFTAALRDANKSVSVGEAHDSLALVNLARITLQAQPDSPEATKAAEKMLLEALEFNNPCAPANEMLIHIYLGEINWQEALKHCNALLDLENRHIEDYGEQNRKPTYYYLRGLIYGELGDKANAERDFRTCLAIEPGYQDAEEQIRALECNDVLQEIHNKLSASVSDKLVQAQELLYGKGDKTVNARRALTILDEAIAEAGGSLSEARVVKAVAYDALREFDSAVAEAEKALAENPDEFDAQSYITLLNVQNVEKIATQPKKRGLLGGLGKAMLDGIIDSGNGIGNEIAKGVRRGVERGRVEGNTVLVLGSIDSLIEIFNRLAATGFYAFRYINFSNSLLDMAKDIYARSLPYDVAKIAKAVLGVPADKIIYFGSEEDRAAVQAVQQLARSYR